MDLLMLSRTFTTRINISIYYMKSQWKTEKTYFLNYLEKLFGVKNKSKFILF